MFIDIIYQKLLPSMYKYKGIGRIDGGNALNFKEIQRQVTTT